MAYEQNVEFVTRNSTNDLSATATYLYTGVKLDAAGQIIPIAATSDNPFGVLYSDPKAGKAAAIATSGAVKVKAGGTIAAGAQFGFNASGAAITAVTGTPVVGTAMVSAVSGDIFTGLVDFGASFLHA
jgi:hypothetical protein